MAILVKACVMLVVIAIVLIVREKLFSQPPEEIEDWPSESEKEDGEIRQ